MWMVHQSMFKKVHNAFWEEFVLKHLHLTSPVKIICDRERAMSESIRGLIEYYELESKVINCETHIITDIKFWLGKLNSKIKDANESEESTDLLLLEVRNYVKDIYQLFATSETYESTVSEMSSNWDQKFTDYFFNHLKSDIFFIFIRHLGFSLSKQLSPSLSEHPLSE